MQITITGGTGSLSQYIQKGLVGKHEVVLFDAYVINAADTLALEDTRDLVARLRREYLPKLRGMTGRQALISTAKAEKAFGWTPEHSWTDYLPVAAAR